MIFDCCLYNGEKELLEIRLNELSNCNDWVTPVIVEANVTHTGHPKPLYFNEHKHEFFQYKNLMYLAVEDVPEGTPREREAYQRNQIMKALKFLEPKDYDKIIISDIDEIPRASKVDVFEIQIMFASLLMDKYAYYCNTLESRQSWDRARIMTWAYLRDKQPEEVRNSGYDYLITHAGHHYSWVIDPIRKLKSFSHTELDTEENETKVMNKENIWGTNEFEVVEIDLSHPRYLYENQEKFKHLIYDNI